MSYCRTRKKISEFFSNLFSLALRAMILFGSKRFWHITPDKKINGYRHVEQCSGCT
jgi:hypothetical protein